MQKIDGRSRWYLMFWFLWLCTSFVKAQVTDTSISGYVYDRTGRVIPGAQIALAGAQSGTIRTVRTDRFGEYSIVGITPATYTMSVQAPGFAAYTHSGIALGVDTPLTLCKLRPPTSESSWTKI